MDRSVELREALRASEKAFGHFIDKYRVAFSCCLECGALFEIGDVAVAVVDIDGHIAFEHESCPKRAAKGN